MRFVIDLKLPSLNDYVNAERMNRYAGANMKKQLQKDISWFITTDEKIENPSWFRFIWHEGNNKRDKDNVAFAKKFILDALQECGILPNDNNKWVLGFQDEFVYDKSWKVEVIIN